MGLMNFVLSKISRFDYRSDKHHAGIFQLQINVITAQGSIHAPSIQTDSSRKETIQPIDKQYITK